MAETNVHGRHRVLESVARTENVNTLIGSITMSAVAVGGLGAGVWLLATGNPAGGFLGFVPTIVLSLGRGIGAARGRERHDAD